MIIDEPQQDTDSQLIGASVVLLLGFFCCCIWPLGCMYVSMRSAAVVGAAGRECKVIGEY
jgi:hypothetical protein